MNLQLQTLFEDKLSEIEFRNCLACGTTIIEHNCFYGSLDRIGSYFKYAQEAIDKLDFSNCILKSEVEILINGIKIVASICCEFCKKKKNIYSTSISSIRTRSQLLW